MVNESPDTLVEAVMANTFYMDAGRAEMRGSYLKIQ